MPDTSSATSPVLPTADPADHGFDPVRLGRLSGWMEAHVDEGRLPCLGVVIVRDGQVIFEEFLGHRDVESRAPFGADSLVRMYSMTKPVTGTALMMLLEEARLSLDDPVAEYLPELGTPRVLAGGGFQGVETKHAEPITIRHLATHTAGLSYDFFPHEPVSAMYREAGISGALPTRHESLEEWCRALAEMPLRSQPGASWHYSVGMDVLGRLVEVVSGQRFGDFVRERIFAPLGMSDSDFRVVPEGVDRFASAYGPDGKGGFRLVDRNAESVFLDPPAVDFGGSGLISTARDYLRFAQMLLSGGELGGQRILAPKTVELMCSDHLPASIGEAPVTSLSSMRWFKGARFGITGMVVVDPAQNGVPGSVGEFGWGGAASTNFWIDPQEDLTVLLLTQFMPSGTYPLRPQIRSLVYQALVD
jgi:CubicO group peptidase (beta-lactamase class C family)